MLQALAAPFMKVFLFFQISCLQKPSCPLEGLPSFHTHKLDCFTVQWQTKLWTWLHVQVLWLILSINHWFFEFAEKLDQNKGELRNRSPTDGFKSFATFTPRDQSVHILCAVKFMTCELWTPITFFIFFLEIRLYPFSNSCKCLLLIHF